MYPNAELLLGASGVVLQLFVLWLTVVVCLRFSPWVLPTVLVLDFVVMPLFFAVVGFAPGYIVWKLWFFWTALRWEPIRGVFRLPRWPRTQHMRGPGQRAPRDVREPMPWTAGPFTH